MTLLEAEQLLDKVKKKKKEDKKFRKWRKSIVCSELWYEIFSDYRSYAITFNEMRLSKMFRNIDSNKIDLERIADHKDTIKDCTNMMSGGSATVSMWTVIERLNGYIIDIENDISIRKLQIEDPYGQHLNQGMGFRTWSGTDEKKTIEQFFREKYNELHK